jgi:hypothetical protein
MAEILSKVIYEEIESSGDQLNRSNFNTIFDSFAFNHFDQVGKAS